MYARGHKGEKLYRLCVLSILVSVALLSRERIRIPVRTYLSYRENVSEEPRERIPPQQVSFLFPLSSFPFPLFPLYFWKFQKKFVTLYPNKQV